MAGAVGVILGLVALTFVHALRPSSPAIAAAERPAAFMVVADSRPGTPSDPVRRRPINP